MPILVPIRVRFVVRCVSKLKLESSLDFDAYIGMPKRDAFQVCQLNVAIQASNWYISGKYHWHTCMLSWITVVDR